MHGSITIDFCLIVFNLTLRSNQVLLYIWRRIIDQLMSWKRQINKELENSFLWTRTGQLLVLWLTPKRHMLGIQILYELREFHPFACLQCLALSHSHTLSLTHSHPCIKSCLVHTHCPLGGSEICWRRQTWKHLCTFCSKYSVENHVSKFWILLQLIFSPWRVRKLRS